MSSAVTTWPLRNTESLVTPRMIWVMSWQRTWPTASSVLISFIHKPAFPGTEKEPARKKAGSAGCGSTGLSPNMIPAARPLFGSCIHDREVTALTGLRPFRHVCDAEWAKKSRL